MNILRGIIRLARGRGDGMAAFPATVDGFLTSLTPLIGFALVGCAAAAIQADTGTALALLLFSGVGLLAPPVLSHALARRWGREEDWLRYATAYNWVQCVLPLTAVPLLIAIALMVQLGFTPAAAVGVGLVGLFGYTLFLGWVVARHGLDLSRGRAARFVAMVTIGTYVVASVPGWIMAIANGSAG